MKRHNVSGISCALATAGGLGYIGVAPGTWGSLLGWLCGVLLTRLVAGRIVDLLLLVSFVLAALIAGEAERAMKRHDASAIIIDEVWGMAAIVLVLPWVAVSPLVGFVAFLLFRFFDIVKPQPLPRLERLPGGWGVLADDAGAAVYTILVLWVVRLVRG